MEQQDNTQIFVDNQVVILISNNPVFYGKTKHFKIKLYFLRDTKGRRSEINLLHNKRTKC